MSSLYGNIDHAQIAFHATTLMDAEAKRLDDEEAAADTEGSEAFASDEPIDHCGDDEPYGWGF